MTTGTEHIPEPYRSAHKFSSNHKQLLLAKSKVGCFYCYRVFSPHTIEEWIDDDTTAICPHCSVDSVIPQTDAFFLTSMNLYWFAVPDELVP